jgi:uncharacterized coiled-coil protein SlyX
MIKRKELNMGCNYTPNKKETKSAEEVARSIVYGEGDDSKEFLIERITAAIEAERQRVEGLEQRIGFHEQTIRELNKVPLPEVVNLRELTSKLRCRITELEKENERLSKNQLKTNGFEIEVSWYWGRSCSFKETAKFWSQTNDREEIKKHVLHLVNKIKDQYCFDCGDLSMPLNPSIGSVRITPSVKIESEYIYDEEILQNNLIKEHASTLLDPKGGKTECT